MLPRFRRHRGGPSMKAVIFFTVASATAPDDVPAGRTEFCNVRPEACVNRLVGVYATTQVERVRSAGPLLLCRPLMTAGPDLLCVRDR